MDLDTAFFWLALMGGALTFVRGVQLWSRGDRVILVKGALVLAITGLAYLGVPAHAGIIGAAAWAGIVLTPNLLAQALGRAVARQRYGLAENIATLLYVLHPSPAMRLALVDRRATSRFHADDIAGGERIYREAAQRADAAAWAEVSRLRMLGRWDELVAFFQAHVSPAELKKKPSLLHPYLRALGEIGQRRQLLTELARAEALLGGLGAMDLRAGAWLFAFAFSGRRDLVDRLLAGPLRAYADPIKRFWEATSDLARGDPSALGRLAVLSRVDDAIIRGSVARRLETASALTAEELTPEDLAIVARAATALDHEERFGTAARQKRPFVVYTLVAANVLVFIVGRIVGAEEFLDLGAFYEPWILDGDWWRFFTSMFLHLDELHLGMNMLALWVLGPYVENALGRVRFTVTYLLAGLGGGLGLFLVAYLGFRDADKAIGASGCIMGVIGATMAIVLRGYLKDRAKIARSRLLMLTALVALQSVVDLETPQISFTAHFGGVVTGFLVALLLRHHTSNAAKTAPTS